tara:strand:+ start:244 stop:717 length:474 start_codon:yes stop_codon:yes gene_type:complete
MSKGVSQSHFYMWRTLFALAHADHVVSEEEVRFMAEALEDVPFSDEQKATLTEDISKAQNIEFMFAGITEPLDQAEFFNHARELCHIDGDYGLEEQQIMLKLEEMHLKTTNVDSLVGNVRLEFEDENSSQSYDSANQELFEKTVFSFRSWFSKKDKK